MDRISERVRALEDLVEPIAKCSRLALRDKAEQLKQTYGEGWAIGEMVVRACIMLDALEMQAGESESAIRDAAMDDVWGAAHPVQKMRGQ